MKLDWITGVLALLAAILIAALYFTLPDPDPKPPTCDEQLAEARNLNALFLRDIRQLEDSIRMLHIRHNETIGAIWDRVEGNE